MAEKRLDIRTSVVGGAQAEGAFQRLAASIRATDQAAKRGGLAGEGSMFSLLRGGAFAAGIVEGTRPLGDLASAFADVKNGTVGWADAISSVLQKIPLLNAGWSAGRGISKLGDALGLATDPEEEVARIEKVTAAVNAEAEARRKRIKLIRDEIDAADKEAAASKRFIEDSGLSPATMKLREAERDFQKAKDDAAKREKEAGTGPGSGGVFAANAKALASAQTEFEIKRSHAALAMLDEDIERRKKTADELEQHTFREFIDTADEIGKAARAFDESLNEAVDIVAGERRPVKAGGTVDSARSSAVESRMSMGVGSQDGTGKELLKQGARQERLLNVIAEKLGRMVAEGITLSNVTTAR